MKHVINLLSLDFPFQLGKSFLIFMGFMGMLFSGVLYGELVSCFLLSPILGAVYDLMAQNERVS